MRHVIVVGGGLAGLAAAVSLSQHGRRVDLLESRPRLGGRASSFLDPASGEWVDNCQHVSLGCCTNLEAFCQQVGIAEFFRREPRLHFIGPDGRLCSLAAAPLPAPLHLLPGFLRMPFLSWRDKFTVARGLSRLCMGRQKASPSAGTNGDAAGFLDWLRTHGQTPGAIERFWSVILTSALSERLEQIGIDDARKVFLDAFLANARAWEMLVPTVPLGRLYGERVVACLQRNGATLQLNAAVQRIRVAGGAVTGLELRDGRLLEADAYVIAVPPDRLLAMLPDEVASQHTAFVRLADFTPAPITSVHLWYDRPVMPLPHVVVVGRTIQWLFNRSALHDGQDTTAPHQPGAPATGAAPSAHCYQAVISASHDLAGQGKEAILQTVRSEIEALWPDARTAQLVHARVVTEHRAVYNVTPGIGDIRPPQTTPLDNLFLAGDWTRTGWPATMEGAVRSGYLAAEALLHRAGHPATILKPDLPRSRLVRWLLA